METIKISDKARVCITKDMNDAGMATLLSMLEKHDKITYIHSQNVAYIASQILIQARINKNTAREIIRGALLHDIGKIKISSDILNKKGNLTKEEFALIKEHPKYGIELVEKYAPHLLTDITKDIILHHHEEEGGIGYPDKLIEVSPFTELISLIDKYDAMTSERSYGRRYSSVYTIEHLMQQDISNEYLKYLQECDSK